MTYDLGAAIREDLGEQFKFTIDGREFVLPHMKDVPKAALDAPDGLPGILASLKIALGGQWRAFDKVPLTIDGINKLYDEWSKHSGVEPGE